MPPFSTLYADLPASHAQISRHLGLTQATVKKYLREDQAPRAVMLALFWESTWGRSAADCEASNYAQLQYMGAQILREKNQLLLEQIALLEQQLALQEDGAANGPIYRIGLKPLNF